MKGGQGTLDKYDIYVRWRKGRANRLGGGYSSSKGVKLVKYQVYCNTVSRLAWL